MEEVVILCAARTAIGAFGGSLSSFSAVELCKEASIEALKRANIPPDLIDEVVIGNVLSSGLGQNIARQVAIKAGLPITTPAMTLSKVCGSGLRAVSLGAQMIKSGDVQTVLVGGVESMSNAPYLINKARWGMKMGNGELVDSMIKDGLWDATNDYHMGKTAENIAERWNISRQEQDEFAYGSQVKASYAINEGKFVDEIVPLFIKGKNNCVIKVDTDEYPRANTTVDKLSKLKPAFETDGTVTAGNSSGLNDGAAMLVLMSKKKADELGLKYLAKIVSYAQVGVDPSIMGYGVVPSTLKALDIAGLKVDDLDLIEANEAFASQALCVQKELKIDSKKLNVNGGAIALGHPIGASGARILTTLVYEMQKRNSKYGLATLCIGGGMGTAMIISRDGL